MDLIYKIFQFIKPMLPIAVIVGALQLTGLPGHVVSFGQSAMLKTGALNAGTEMEAEEGFDYNFIAERIDGHPLVFDSLKGKVVFLNLWATWCGPCRAEMPTIQALYDETKNQDIAFVMLSIDRKDPQNKVREYIAKNNYTFPVYILKGNPTDQLKVPSIPTTFIISKQGKIIRKEVGMRNYDTEKFKKFLRKEAEQ